MPPRTASKSTTRTTTTRRRAGSNTIAEHNAKQTTAGTTATKPRRSPSRVESAIGGGRKPKATTAGSRIRGAKTGTTVKSSATTGPSRSVVMAARKGALDALQPLDDAGRGRALQWLADQFGVIPSKR